MRVAHRQTILAVAGLSCTALLLTVIQPPFGMAGLAWVAYAPLGLGSLTSISPRHLALVSYLLGSLYWLVNLYWIGPITVLGWMALCLYLAMLWPAMALAIRACRAKGLPTSISMAVVVTACERLQGFPLGGFYWRLLAHSQFRNTGLIQIADLVGAGGVSFLLALVSGLLVEVAKADRRRLASVAAQALVAAAMVAATLLYGRWRLAQAPLTIQTGSTVACLQSSVPQSVKRTFQASEQIFGELLDMADQVGTQADLSIWPETSIQAILDGHLWPLLDSESAQEATGYDRRLRQQCLRHRTYALVGAYGGRIRQEPDGQWVLDRFNSAFLYRSDGTRDPNRYDKIHLVLFGEYLPFRHNFRWLYHLLMKLTPYNYDYSLEPGSQRTVFYINRPSPAGPVCRVGVLICYEDTVPALARKMVLGRDGRKCIDALINISNDGWFVRFSDDTKQVRCSTELVQHLAACTFRAVENRVSVARAVNTGISCIIDPCGRIVDGALYASDGWPQRALDRQGMAGWFVDRIPVDSRIAPFSRFGQWLDDLCAVGLVVGWLASAAARLKRARHG